MGDVLHRTTHVGQRPHQRTDQQAQQQGNHGHRNQYGDHRRAAELAQRCISLVLVDRQTNVPVGRRQPGDRGKRQQPLLTIERDLTQARIQTEGLARVDVLEVFHHLFLVRADNDLPVPADQKGVTEPAELHRVDDLDQRVQAQVTASHASYLACSLDRAGDSHHQAAHGSQIRRAENGFAGVDGGLVPGPLTWIVASRHIDIGPLGEHTFAVTDVGELKGRHQRRLRHKSAQVGIDPLEGYVLGEVFQHQNASAQPVLYAAGRQLTRLAHRGLKVLIDGGALQVVVVQGEQGKGQHHNTGRSQKNFMTELQIHDKASQRDGKKAQMPEQLVT
ncbi:Uncharacterized protein AC516_2796 [Pseudomonas amygdali pv. sesami]|nr:Uncharacterized protein AC516_2796 [Pseudomonas amygdali pv. sesami]